MSYLNLLFPTRVSDGSRGGPEFKTALVQYQSGFESTDRRWPLPRHKYSIVAGTLTEDEIDELLPFSWVVGGRANSFRFQVPAGPGSVFGHPVRPGTAATAGCS